MIAHAGLVAARVGGLWRGALLEGPSGAGKSDLALRAMAAGLALVADDRVSLWVDAGRLYGRAPPSLAGLIEVRGLGVAPAPALPFCRIVVVCPLLSAPGEVERMPGETTGRLGVALPLRPLWPFEPAAPLKVRMLLEQLGPDA
ncbi:MAG: HPr kinase/phosphorylase [Caulobacter sp.]